MFNFASYKTSNAKSTISTNLKILTNNILYLHIFFNLMIYIKKVGENTYMNEGL